jgi:D-alanyl-D-alanine carboxypeptidase/D-alanyl-D-alanine-endopeptidase (penicillin-binding protein 4)
VAADEPSQTASTGNRSRTIAITAVVVLVVALGGAAGLDATGHLPGGLIGNSSPTPSPTTSPTPVRPPAAAVLRPATSTAAVALRTGRLRALLDGPALGPGVGAVVVDATTGGVVLDQDDATARTPASIAKLTTTAAALMTLGPGRRLATRVVAGATPGEIVLVGAGDATLTVRKPRAGDYPRLASLSALADATAAALRSQPASGSSTTASSASPSATSSASPSATSSGTPSATSSATSSAPSITVRVDDSLFSGPAVAPDWPATYVGSGVVSPVDALAVDAGRVRPGADAREPDPAIAAGRDLARLLAARGITVTGAVSRTTAPAGGRTLAQVLSPTVAELVEVDLSTSDNDLAEALLRLSAIARGRPGSFSAGTTTVKEVLGELGVPTGGLDLRDGSGLARSSAIAPVTLARLLQVAAGAAHPVLRTLVTSLPVAGFSGTLAFRYTRPPSDSGAGLVRAKTGTLTGVSTLAGLTEQSGRTLLFVVMSDHVPIGGTIQAREALDRFAATVAG